MQVNDVREKYLYTRILTLSCAEFCLFSCKNLIITVIQTSNFRLAFSNTNLNADHKISWTAFFFCRPHIWIFLGNLFADLKVSTAYSTVLIFMLCWCACLCKFNIPLFSKYFSVWIANKLQRQMRWDPTHMTSYSCWFYTWSWFSV